MHLQTLADDTRSPKDTNHDVAVRILEQAKMNTKTEDIIKSLTDRVKAKPKPAEAAAASSAASSSGDPKTGGYTWQEWRDWKAKEGNT